MTAVPTVGVAQLLAAMRRRRLPALCALILIFAVALATALLLPSRYVSTGTILIEQQELPADFVRSTVSSYATQRIQIISQRVMTTDNLMGIIERYDLYLNMRKQPREELIQAMRRDTNLRMISADVMDPRGGGPTKATIAFAISFSSSSAELAAKVANELVSLYLQQNIESRQRSSRDAVAFLGGQSARLDAEIKTLEGKLAELKRQHGNELPELKQLNSSAMDRAADEIRDTDSQLTLVDQQITYLDTQLAQINPAAQVYTSTGERVPTPTDRLKILRSEYARMAALYSSDHPDVQRLRREIAGLEANHGSKFDAGARDYRAQLEAAQSQLTSTRQRYAAVHPDVVRLEGLVQSLQEKLTAATAAPKDAPPSPAGTAGVSDDAENADNPAYLQMRTQQHNLVMQRKSLEDRRTALRAKLDDYQRRLERMPSVERDYVTIARDLESAQVQYRQMRQKQMDAQTSVNLEVERKGERFTLIDPPFVAGQPASPNRPLIIVFGLILSLGAGAGLIVLLEALDGSVRGRQDLLKLLSVPPLAIVPMMLTSVDLARRQRRRRHTLYGAVYGAAGSVVVAVVMLHFLYRPLDVLWVVALRRLGISG